MAVRIVAVTQPFRGYFQTVDYAYWQQHDGFMQRVPVTEMQVKSQIARPAMAEVVAKGKPYRVFGAAWAGGSTVSKVEVSTDGGRSYATAKLLGAPAKHAWRRWEFAWDANRRRDADMYGTDRTLFRRRSVRVVRERRDKPASRKEWKSPTPKE